MKRKYYTRLCNNIIVKIWLYDQNSNIISISKLKDQCHFHVSYSSKILYFEPYTDIDSQLLILIALLDSNSLIITHLSYTIFSRDNDQFQHINDPFEAFAMEQSRILDSDLSYSNEIESYKNSFTLDLPDKTKYLKVLSKDIIIRSNEENQTQILIRGENDKFHVYNLTCYFPILYTITCVLMSSVNSSNNLIDKALRTRLCSRSADSHINESLIFLGTNEGYILWFSISNDLSKESKSIIRLYIMDRFPSAIKTLGFIETITESSLESKYLCIIEDSGILTCMGVTKKIDDYYYSIELASNRFPPTAHNILFKGSYIFYCYQNHIKAIQVHNCTYQEHYHIDPVDDNFDEEWFTVGIVVTYGISVIQFTLDNQGILVELNDESVHSYEFDHQNMKDDLELIRLSLGYEFNNNFIQGRNSNTTTDHLQDLSEQIKTLIQIQSSMQEDLEFWNLRCLQLSILSSAIQSSPSKSSSSSIIDIPGLQFSVLINKLSVSNDMIITLSMMTSISEIVKAFQYQTLLVTLTYRHNDNQFPEQSQHQHSYSFPIRFHYHKKDEIDRNEYKSSWTFPCHLTVLDEITLNCYLFVYSDKISNEYQSIERISESDIQSVNILIFQHVIYPLDYIDSYMDNPESIAHSKLNEYCGSLLNDYINNKHSNKMIKTNLKRSQNNESISFLPTTIPKLVSNIAIDSNYDQIVDCVDMLLLRHFSPSLESNSDASKDSKLPKFLSNSIPKSLENKSITIVKHRKYRLEESQSSMNPWKLTYYDLSSSNRYMLVLLNHCILELSCKCIFDEVKGIVEYSNNAYKYKTTMNDSQLMNAYRESVPFTILQLREELLRIHRKINIFAEETHIINQNVESSDNKDYLHSEELFQCSHDMTEIVQTIRLYSNQIWKIYSKLRDHRNFLRI